LFYEEKEGCVKAQHLQMNKDAPFYSSPSNEDVKGGGPRKTIGKSNCKCLHVSVSERYRLSNDNETQEWR